VVFEAGGPGDSRRGPEEQGSVVGPAARVSAGPGTAVGERRCGWCTGHRQQRGGLRRESAEPRRRGRAVPTCRSPR